MGFYDRMQGVALRLLTKYGQDVTLRTLASGAGTYNPATGVATQGTATDTTRKGFITESPGAYNGPQYGRTLQDGSLVTDNDKWMLMDANGNAPKLLNHVIADGVDFTIVDVQELKPAGTALMYTLVLRA